MHASPASTSPHHQSSHYDTSQPTTTYTANTQLVTLPRYSDATAIATESPMQPNADATTIATAICIETAHYILVFPRRSHRRYRQQTNADATTTANANAYDTAATATPRMILQRQQRTIVTYQRYRYRSHINKATANGHRPHRYADATASIIAIDDAPPASTSPHHQSLQYDTPRHHHDVFPQQPPTTATRPNPHCNADATASIYKIDDAPPASA